MSLELFNALTLAASRLHYKAPAFLKKRAVEHWE